MKYSTFENGGAVKGNISVNGLTMTGPLKSEKAPTELNELVNKVTADSSIENIDASKISSGTLPTTRMPTMSGDFVSVGGTGVISVSNSGVVPGTHTKVTVNHAGLVDTASSLVATDIPNFGWEKVTSDKPVTLDGYGITNAVSKINGTVNGNIVLSAEPTNGTDVATKAYVDTVLANQSGLQPGDIVTTEGDVIPTGYLRCNGGEISTTTYASLYSVVGDSFGQLFNIGAGTPWANQYNFNTVDNGDITGWTAGTNLPEGLGFSAAVITKSRVYLLGGVNPSGAVSAIRSAPINTLGVIGAWVASGNLPIAVSSSKAVVIKNNIYLLGGSTGTVPTNKTYIIPINPDGTLGTIVAGRNLPVPLEHPQVTVTKDRVYLIGGQTTGTTVVNTVYSSIINADGSLGAWVASGNLPGPMAAGSAIITRNRVFVLGAGTASYVVSNIVYTATINADGTLNSWSTYDSLPVAIFSAQIACTQNRIYLIGGVIESARTAVVRHAPINQDGTIGAWATGTALPAARGTAQVVVTSTRIYLIGGDATGVPVVGTYYAPFNGGANDYSQYYNDSIPVTPNNKFRLPDYSAIPGRVGTYIIKAL